MYHGIKEFKEFIAQVSDNQICKFVSFINMLGFYEGLSAYSLCSDSEIIVRAIEFAKSDYENEKCFMIDKMGAADYCFHDHV